MIGGDKVKIRCVGVSRQIFDKRSGTRLGTPCGRHLLMVVSVAKGTRAGPQGGEFFGHSLLPLS